MRLKTSPTVLLLAIGVALALAQTRSAEKAAPAEPAGPDASKPDASKSIPSKPDVSKAGSSQQEYSKEAFIIERLRTDIHEESDGTGTRELTAEVRMLADAGVKAFAVLNFTYTSANEVVDFDYVRVRKPDGTVVKTPDYNIQDMPGEVTRSAPLYSDIHEKHVAVKGLGVGDVLEYLVRFRVLKPQVPGQFWYEDSFNKTSIVRDERLEISVPRDKYVKVVSPEFKPEISEEGTRRVYRWAHNNLEVKEKDPDEVPRRIPPNPDVQVTTFASWEEVGRWYGGLQKDPLAVTPAIQAKAAELTEGLKTDEEKIHAIYNFVSLKFHYIGLDFGIGRYQPHAADDVLDNGYGDCKDKHTLLASLLEAVGIEAWPALIHASRKLDAEVPSPAQFNHVITVVPLGGSYIWLDTTPEVAPYGLLLLTLRDKQALVIPTHEPAKLMTTPADSPVAQRQEFSMEGKLGADGTFTGHAEQLYQGDVEVLFRMVFRQVPESQWRDAVQRFSYAMNFMGDVSNPKISPPDEIDKPLTISYDYVRKNFGDWEDHHTLAPLPPMGMEVTKDSKEKKPQEPVLLGAVGKVSYRARVELPEGYHATAPAKCHLVEPYAEYTANTVIEGQVMTTTRELVIKKTEVALSDWEGFRKFGRSMGDDEFNYMTLVRVTQIAAALRESPPEQEEDLRKKLKDDPKDHAAAERLGNLLSRQSKYTEAIEVMDTALKSSPDSFPLQLELGQAYLKAGQNEKAIIHLRAAVELKSDDPMILNNVAYTLAENKLNLDLAQQYAGKAVDELDKQMQEAESSQQLRATYHETGLRVTYQLALAWDTLGWVYFRQGDLKRAESFVRPSWLLGEESEVAEHLGEIYEKEGRTQQAARAYEHALAVSSVPFSPQTSQEDMQRAYRTRIDQIKARYKKLMGKDPSLFEIRRLPNGEWTQTPAEQLRHSREVKLANAEKLSSSAQFIVTFKPGKVESAEYESGDDELEPLADKLKAAHYPLEFPPQSGATLVLRVEVKCQSTAPCIATLVNPVPPGPQFPGPAY
jgi:Flp pilus assembly protein TadD/transglutaminase-like putative cysteine protease